MKGIAGIVYPDVFQMDDMMHLMLATLKHRKPHGATDIHIYQNIQIGIVGGKFAANEKNTILAAIDGHIANGDEIRQTLVNEGYHFRGKDCDELIIHGYEKWDTALFEHIKGEFAILIFDNRKKKILLCRDRIGKKPLYWFQNSHYFIFGSELKALMATGIIPQTPALDSLSAYLYLGYIPQDMAPIQGINKLLPAHYLQYNFDGTKNIQSYWSYSSHFEKQNKNPLPVIGKELDHMLKECVRSSLPKSEKIGCFLSGGLGSACIAKYVSEIVPKENVTTFSVGFQGENEEGIDSAESVASYLGLKHQIKLITPSDLLNDFVKMCWHLDEPLGDPQVLSSWNLAHLASKQTNMVLSSMGADELFAGHSRYSIAEQRRPFIQKNWQSFFNFARKALIPLFNTFYKPIAYSLIKQSRANSLQFGYLKRNAFMSEHEIFKASPRLAGIFEPEVFLNKFYQLNRVHSRVASYLYFDVKTRLPDEYLTQLERTTAAFSLNWNVPFIDRNIVEFVARLPEPEILQESETGSYLKAIMKNHLPSSIVNTPKRTKKNFLRSWINKSELQGVFLLLPEGALVESGLIAKPWIQQKIANLESDPNAFKQIWSILQLEVWFRLYVHSAIETQAPDVPLDEFLRESL